LARASRARNRSKNAIRRMPVNILSPGPIARRRDAQRVISRV